MMFGSAAKCGNGMHNKYCYVIWYPRAVTEHRHRERRVHRRSRKWGKFQ